MSKKDLTAVALVGLLSKTAPEESVKVVEVFLTDYSEKISGAIEAQLATLTEKYESVIIVVREKEEEIIRLRDIISNFESDNEKDLEIERLTSLLSEKENENTTLSEQLKGSLEIVSDLSQQVAVHSTIEANNEILVSIDGDNYLLQRGTIHTLTGPVEAEDAAKDQDFLRELVEKGSGNIKPVSN